MCTVTITVPLLGTGVIGKATAYYNVAGWKIENWQYEVRKELKKTILILCDISKNMISCRYSQYFSSKKQSLTTFI